MSRRTSRVSLNCEALTARLVPAIIPPGGTSQFFDTALTATLEADFNSNKLHVQVDGSDFEDHITVVSFSRNRGELVLQLEKFSDGQLISSEPVKLASHLLNLRFPLAINAKGGNDQIINSTSAAMSASGGNGEDYISGGSAVDVINGDADDDTLMGRRGPDIIHGGSGADYIRGDRGNDFIQGEDGEDMLYGEDGIDTLQGGSNNDSIFGGGQNDNIEGGDGDDTLYGDNDNSLQDGNDVIFGNAGNDWMDGGGGKDFLNGDFGGFDQFSTTPDDGNDTMYGGIGNDTMQGNGGDDILNGDAGSDRLLGQDGSDQLFGGRGRDYLDGGDDDPDLRCDLLNGGLGGDTFVRHKHIAGIDDADVFADYDESLGDETEDEWGL